MKDDGVAPAARGQVQDSLQKYVIPETGNPFEDKDTDEDEDKLDNNEAAIDGHETDDFNSDLSDKDQLCNCVVILRIIHILHIIYSLYCILHIYVCVTAYSTLIVV